MATLRAKTVSFFPEVIGTSKLATRLAAATISGTTTIGDRRRIHFSCLVAKVHREYRVVLAIVGRWQKYPQPSYNLDTRNCVTFVREIAIALRLPASNDTKFIRSPREFLEDMELWASKTNRLVTTGGTQRPLPRLNAKTRTVKTGPDGPTP